jgi:hypothetical protein
MEDGSIQASLEACGDADDVFVDRKRERAYVSCGAGFLDIYSTQSKSPVRLARLPTASGARTSLFVSELDRLYLAVSTSAAGAAQIRIYRPEQ